MRSESRKRKSTPSASSSRPQSPSTDPKRNRGSVEEVLSASANPSQRISEPLTVSISATKHSVPSAHSGSSSVGAVTNSSLCSPQGSHVENAPSSSNTTTASNDVSDWKVDTRLRPTTLLVTAASESAANTRMAVKSPPASIQSQVSIPQPNLGLIQTNQTLIIAR